MLFKDLEPGAEFIIQENFRTNGIDQWYKLKKLRQAVIPFEKTNLNKYSKEDLQELIPDTAITEDGELVSVSPNVYVIKLL